MNTRSILILTAAGLMGAAPALAQVSATAATNLNMRVGPSSNQQVLGVIPAAGEVTVLGCQEVGSWCQVDFQGNQGWVHGSYLNAIAQEQQQVVVVENGERLLFSAEPSQPSDPAFQGANAAFGAAGGAYVASALIGGPAAIIVGGLLGASALGSGELDPAVSYVQANPVDPMSMEGEVIVGAGIPQGVEIVTIPGTNYGYLNANGSPVIIDQNSRRIVEVAR